MKIAILALAVLVSGCGFESVDNEMMGQVKRVHHETPIFCPDYDDADVSLGIMRNGVGSMSTQDVIVKLSSRAQVDTFMAAASSGKLVKIKYRVKRLAICTTDNYVDDVAIVE